MRLSSYSAAMTVSTKAAVQSQVLGKGLAEFSRRKVASLCDENIIQHYKTQKKDVISILWLYWAVYPKTYTGFILNLIIQLPTSNLSFSPLNWSLLELHCSLCSTYFTRKFNVAKSERVQMPSMLRSPNTTKNHNLNHHRNKYSRPRKRSVPMGCEHKSIWRFLPVASDLISI